MFISGNEVPYIKTNSTYIEEFLFFIFPGLSSHMIIIMMPMITLNSNILHPFNPTELQRLAYNLQNKTGM
jgi:hypothetical protein